MPLFGGKHKTPQELVRNLKEALLHLASLSDRDEKKALKVSSPPSLGKAQGMAGYLR